MCGPRNSPAVHPSTRAAISIAQRWGDFTLPGPCLGLGVVRPRPWAPPLCCGAKFQTPSKPQTVMAIRYVSRVKNNFTFYLKVLLGLLESCKKRASLGTPPQLPASEHREPRCRHQQQEGHTGHSTQQTEDPTSVWLVFLLRPFSLSQDPLQEPEVPGSDPLPSFRLLRLCSSFAT